MIVSLEKAKNYLRVEHNLDDDQIENMILTGEKLTEDTIRGQLTGTAVEETAVLFCVAYLYENKEDAKMDELARNLRYVLYTQREAKF